MKYMCKKVEIFDIHSHKEMYQPQQYRFLAAEYNYDEKRTKDMLNTLKHGKQHLYAKKLI
jgi:hypothetical protein